MYVMPCGIVKLGFTFVPISVHPAMTRAPLPITEALGNAIAGRPHIMRFMDQRNLKGT